MRFSRSVHQRHRRQRCEAGGDRAELDDLHAAVDDGVAQPEEEHRQLFFHVGADDDDRRAGSADVVDRGLRQTDDRDTGKPVVELRVDVVGADDALGQLRPGVGRFVGEASPAEHRHRGGVGAPDRVRGRADGLGPRRGDELTVLAHERLGQALVGFDGLEVEATLVAQPTPVDGIDVDALVAQHVVAAGLDRHAAADRARRARRTRPSRGPTGEP